MVSSFSVDVGRFVAKTKARLDIVVRYISLELFRRVVLKTPVDTGRARGSWQLAIGEIPDDTVEINDKDGTVSVSRAVAAAQGIRAGDVVYIVSNLPYIRALEYGWSQQAPNGMVRQTIGEVQEWLAAVVGQAKREAP